MVLANVFLVEFSKLISYLLVVKYCSVVLCVPKKHISKKVSCSFSTVTLRNSIQISETTIAISNP